MSSNVIAYTPEGHSKQIRNEVTNAGAKCEKLPNSLEICEAVHAIGKPTRNVKENSLFVEKEKGLVVVTGCAHAGIMDLVKIAKEMSGSLLRGILRWHLPSNVDKIGGIFGVFRKCLWKHF